MHGRGALLASLRRGAARIPWPLSDPMRERRLGDGTEAFASGAGTRESNAGAPRLWCRRSAELLGEPEEKPFRPANVAEPIRVSIPHYFAYELRAALAEPLERLVDVVHGEHDA